MPERSVHGLMEQIRVYLGQRGFHRHGLPNFHHAIACAAADALEDAELAIAAYAPTGQNGLVGLDYLQVYGVLQATYLQQDAVRLLRVACGLPLEDFPGAMRPIRDLRNRAIGHPADIGQFANTPKRNKLPPPATFIGRYSIAGGSLSLMQVDVKGAVTHSKHPLAQMLADHTQALMDWLGELVGYLQAAEQARRVAIAAQGQLAALLHSSWSYLLSKVHEAGDASDVAKAGWARAGIPALREMLDHLEAGLADRDLDPIDPWHLDTARGALDRLDAHLAAREAGHDMRLEIAAFATLAERHFQYIADLLPAIDERLSEPAPPETRVDGATGVER